MHRADHRVGTRRAALSRQPPKAPKCATKTIQPELDELRPRLGTQPLEIAAETADLGSGV